MLLGPFVTVWLLELYEEDSTELPENREAGAEVDTVSGLSADDLDVVVGGTEDLTVSLAVVELSVAERCTEVTPELISMPELREVPEITALPLDECEDIGVVKAGKDVKIRVVPDPDRKLVTVKAVEGVLAVGKPAVEPFAGAELD